MEQNSSGRGPAGGFDSGRLKDVQSWRRSRNDRMLAGVCGGIGRALNIDPVLIRVVMAVLIITGPGIFFYVAAWLLMPDEGSDRSAAQGLLGDRVRPDHPWLWPAVIGGCVFIAIAMMSSFNFGKMVPGPLVVLGLLWLFVFRRKGQKKAPGSTWCHPGVHGHSQPPADRQAPPAAQPPAYGVSAPTQTGPPPPPAGPSSSATQRPQDRPVEPVQPVWTEDDPLGLYVDEPAAPQRTQAAQPPVKGYRGVKSIVVALTGIAIAIAWVAGAATQTMLVIGLATLGLGMLLGGFLGRTLALLPLGILLAVGVALSMLFPSMPRDFSDVKFAATPDQPITATNTTYTFDAGAVHLDLTKATFAPGAKVVVGGGLGEIVVKVPQNVDVTGNLSAKLGDLNGLGHWKGGNDSMTLDLNDLGADGKAGPQSVELDLDVKFGSIKVERG